jgi:BirA family biotin operon repressor/biotin-[acetyl-CoA-carboxylase] ligase
MELRLVRHGVVDSTNERALVAVAQGEARHGDVHVAEGQSAGRGRLGHRWASPSGEGLYLSLVLLPASAPNPAALTMGAGLAVLEAVRALGAGGARLKWPNDVLAAHATGAMGAMGRDGTEAKLAGILVEARGLDPLRPHAVVGIGLNVLQASFPADLERPGTSLALLGLDVGRERALEACLAALGPRMDQACAAPERIAADYAAASRLPGRRVRVQQGSRELTGLLRSLTLDGLDLVLDGGGRARVPLEHARTVECLERGAG